MLEPGHFGLEEVEIFQGVVREAAFSHDAHVEEMLIRVWRLGPEIETFMRGLDRDVAISIFSMFPKDKAIQHARKAFPGAWADVLDPEFRTVKFSPEQCKEIADRAEKQRALLDFSRLNHYRQLSEVMRFLKTANPEEEKEIYLVAKPNSAIHQTRAPFYVLLEASEALLNKFVPLYTPQQWTLALFNVNRALRVKVQNTMGEKQRFLFVERMKQLDSNHPDPIQVGDLREKMAAHFAQFEKSESILDEALEGIAKGVIEEGEKGGKAA
jgi:hypothetical protein